MKILAITQARIGSSRLPAKVLKEINGQSLLEIHLRRLLKSQKISQLVVATTNEEGVEKIVNIAESLNVPVYQGDLHDVLDRYYQAALPYHPDWVVRITSDCPLVDPLLLDEVIDFAIQKDVDYVCNVLTHSFPHGLDIEVFKYSALKDAWQNAKLPAEREHVTPYIRRQKDENGELIYTVLDYPYKENLKHIRMTVDEESDFIVIENLVKDLGIDAHWKEYVQQMIEKNYVQINSHVLRKKIFDNTSNQ